MLGREVLLLLQGALFFIGSISDMGVFPKTLTVEEETALLKQLSEGDEEAKRRLVEHNLRLVIHIAKRFANTDIDIDDLVSIGTIGLIKAIDRFDPTKQARLATFASTCIENEILMTLRAAKKETGNVLFSDCLGADEDGNEMVYEDILGTQDCDYEAKIETEENIRRLCRMIGELTDMERVVLELRYGLTGACGKQGRPGLTQQNVAERLGISRSYVSRIETRALKKLAKKFGMEDS